MYTNYDNTNFNNVTQYTGQHYYNCTGKEINIAIQTSCRKEAAPQEVLKVQPEVQLGDEVLEVQPEVVEVQLEVVEVRLEVQLDETNLYIEDTHHAIV